MLGIVAGLITAFLVAQMKIPSFVASLTGWLIYRGAILVVTESTGTIIINNEAFNAIGNGFIPDIPDIGILPGVHKLTLLLGIVAIIAMIFSELNERRKKQSYNFETLPTEMFVIKLVFISAIIGTIRGAQRQGPVRIQLAPDRSPWRNWRSAVRGHALLQNAAVDCATR